MEPSLFNEAQADKRIIKSLLGTSRTLWEELEQHRAMINFLREQTNRRTKDMSMLLKAEDGALYAVHKAEELSVEAAQELLAHFKEEVTMLEEFLGVAALTAPAEEAPAQPADQPAEQAPVAPEQPVEAASAAPEAPAQPEQPVEQPAAPEAPVDAPSEPVAPAEAPAVDPNVVPAPAPEQPAQPVDQPAPVDLAAQPPLQ